MTKLIEVAEMILGGIVLIITFALYLVPFYIAFHFALKYW